MVIGLVPFVRDANKRERVRRFIVPAYSRYESERRRKPVVFNYRLGDSTPAVRGNGTDKSAGQINPTAVFLRVRVVLRRTEERVP